MTVTHHPPIPTVFGPVVAVPAKRARSPDPGEFPPPKRPTLGDRDPPSASSSSSSSSSSFPAVPPPSIADLDSALWDLPAAPTTTVHCGGDAVVLSLGVPRPLGFPDIDEGLPSQVTAYNLGMIFGVLPRFLVNPGTQETIPLHESGVFPLCPLRHVSSVFHLVGSPRSPPSSSPESLRQRSVAVVLRSLQHEGRKATDTFRWWRHKVHQRRRSVAGRCV